MPPIRSERSLHDATIALSEKLLEGWTLLSESCPDTNVPLVQRDGTILSVGSGKTFTRINGELQPIADLPPVTPSAPRPQTTFSSPMTTPSMATPSSRPMDNWAPTATPASIDKRLSAEITEKLLQGWTLSSHHCPETGVPLLRTPKGELHSVRTGQTYPAEAPPGSSSFLSQPSPSALTSSALAGSTMAAPPPVLTPQALMRPGSGGGSLSLPAVYMPLDRRTVSSSTEQALLRKIEGARTLLETTDDLEAATKIVDFIAKCGAALDVLSKQ